MLSFIELLLEIHAQIVIASPPTRWFFHRIAERNGLLSQWFICFLELYHEILIDSRPCDKFVNYMMSRTSSNKPNINFFFMWFTFYPPLGLIEIDSPQARRPSVNKLNPSGSDKCKSHEKWDDILIFWSIISNYDILKVAWFLIISCQNQLMPFLSSWSTLQDYWCSSFICYKQLRCAVFTWVGVNLQTFLHLCGIFLLDRLFL